MTTPWQAPTTRTPGARTGRSRGPYASALLWGDLGMLTGATTAVLVALPFYPHDVDGWESLGWTLGVLALGALLGLLFGTVALWRGLRRCDADHPLATAVVFVPLAGVLAAVSAGVAALAAPPLAHWLVVRVSQWRCARAPRNAPPGGVQVGYGPAGQRPVS